MKIDEFEVRGAPQDLIDFKDQVTILLNNGKYSSIVVGTPPTWTARNGEFVFFDSSSVLRVYFYNNNTWGFIEYPAGGGALIVAVSNNVTTVSNTLLNVSNNLVAVSNNLVTGSTTILNVSNNLISVSNNVVTGSTTLLNVSNNLVTVSNNVVTGSTTLLNVSNNLITVSNNQETQITRLTNVSNNLVTTSGNVANLIVQATNGALKGWIQFTGTGALGISDHYNVASLTRTGAGQFEVVWVTTMANRFYSIAGNASRALTVGLKFGLSSLLTGSTLVEYLDNTDAFGDPEFSTMVMTGDQ
jgi:hypothetical protein